MAGPLNSRRPTRETTVGQLRHRVTIQRLDESTRDAAGQVVPAWVDVATVFAAVVPVSGRELFASQQVQANVTHKVTMRHREGVTPKQRVVWVTSKPANMVLNVVSVLPTVGAANSLELMCLHEEV
jgi:SPP1 family predicted phage head-tail adaptor